MTTKYWVSPSDSSWSGTLNWSYTSGGSGGIPVPDSTDSAYFDSSGAGSCYLSSQTDVSSIIFNGYNGALIQNGYGLNLISGSFTDGTFIGGDGADIRVSEDLLIDHCEFTSTDQTLSCDGFFTLSGNFYHNNGIVSLDNSGCILYALDTTFSVLQINTNTNISDLFYVKNLILKSGRAESDSTIHILDNLYGKSTYNSSSNLSLQFDGTIKQHIYNDSGCILPSLIINKTNEEVLCHGDNMIIFSELNIQDGTFNTNGLDLTVQGNKTPVVPV